MAKLDDLMLGQIVPPGRKLRLQAAAGEDGNNTNPHPLYHVQVNFTLAHFDEFYKTYPTVTEGTPMYFAPEDRIRVW